MSRARSIAFSLVLALLLGATLAACIIQIGMDRVPRIGPLDELGVTVALCAATAVVAFPFALLIALKGPALVERASKHNPLSRLRLQFDGKSIAVSAAIILVCWAPWIALQFPGAVNTDAVSQIYQYQSAAPTLYSGHLVDAEFVDHHPLFDTLLYGWFLQVGGMMGSQNAGLFLFALVQAVLSAWALAACCCYLVRLGVPKAFRLVTLAFFALVPLFPLYAATMVKDSTFSTAFAWWLLMYVEAFRTRGAALGRWKFAAFFALATLLCFVTKKTGIYVTVPGMVIMLFAYRTYWKQLLVDIAVPMALFLGLVPAVVYPALGGVEPGGNEEVFGTMYQQVVTAVLADDDLTAEERRAVDTVLDLDAACAAYDPLITDGVKDERRYGTDSGDYVEFLKAYATIGLRHAGDYAWAICRLNGSFLAPGKAITYYHTPEVSQSVIERYENANPDNPWRYELSKPEPPKAWAKAVHDAYMDAASSNPLLAVLLGRGLYGGWIPLICCLLAWARDRRYVLAFVPIALSVAVLVVGPTSSARYVLPLFYCAPLLLGLLCNSLVVSARQRRRRPSGGDADAHDVEEARL